MLHFVAPCRVIPPCSSVALASSLYLSGPFAPYGFARPLAISHSGNLLTTWQRPQKWTDQLNFLLDHLSGLGSLRLAP